MSTRTNLWLCASVLSFVVGRLGAVAAEEAIPAISESELLAGVDAHPRMAVLRATVEIARAEVEAARVLANPTVAYHREAVRSDAEDFLRITVPVEISGRRGKRIAAADAGLAAVENDARRERELVRLEALELFNDAAEARLRVFILQGGRSELVEIVARARGRTAAGDLSGYDLGRLELELGEQEDALADAERELAILRRSLAALAGRPGLLDARDDLSLPDAAGSSASDSVAGARPDHRAALLRREQSEAELAAARRMWIPSLELEGGWKSLQTRGAHANGYVAGLTLRVPLLDNGQGERARALSRGTAARAEAELLEATMPLAAWNAREALVRRVAQASAYIATRLPRAEALVRRAENLYREGERPVFELIDAYRSTRQVRLRALELRREAKRAELDFWRALGRRP